MQTVEKLNDKKNKIERAEEVIRHEKKRLKKINNQITEKEKKFEQASFQASVEREQLKNMHTFIDFLED